MNTKVIIDITGRFDQKRLGTFRDIVASLVWFTNPVAYDFVVQATASGNTVVCAVERNFDSRSGVEDGRATAKSGNRDH